MDLRYWRVSLRNAISKNMGYTRQKRYWASIHKKIEGCTKMNLLEYHHNGISNLYYGDWI